MAKSLTPILLGVDYQAVWFWIQACRLLQPSSPVIKVIWESNDIKSFDDVVVHYRRPIPDERGDPCNSDYYQIKFHVDYNGSLGYKNLTEPAFIGASKFSLLQKLRDVHNLCALRSCNSRFYLVSPWPIDTDDPLARLISNQGGEIRLEILKGCGFRLTEQCWKDHLGVDGQELADILRGLRIEVGQNLSRERDRLNTCLMNVGLKPVEEGCSINPYEDLIRKCSEQGINEFTKENLINICSREGLVTRTPLVGTRSIRLGIRSFLHWAEYMEDEVDQMICFLRYFDNRRIFDHRLWDEAIYPELEQFFDHYVRRGSTYHLILDTHSSLAFASGYLLSKSGIEVSPIQITGSNSQVWKQNNLLNTNYSIDWQTEIIDCLGKGKETALAISVTHEITRDVKTFLESNLPQVNRLIVCSLGEYIGNSSIRDANHAMRLAQSLQKFLRSTRSKSERSQILHIFSSAPNGFLFFLGKLSLDFGQTILYEYDFGSGNPVAYSQSITLPPIKPLIVEKVSKIPR
jgi:hypothetical protein